MWMTGFDVPSCSTMYLDKPMKNHTLMQTIARANRVFKDKPNGLIVDYVGIFRNLEKALSVYADPGTDQGDLPIKDKDELKSLLKTAIDETVEFAQSKGVDLVAIGDTKDVFERTSMKENAVDGLIEYKKEFRRLADRVNTIYKAYLPDPIEPETGQMAYLIRKIVKQMQPDEVDISYVTKKVDHLLDECVEGYQIREPEDGGHIYDLSQVDFDVLKKRFEKGKKRIELDRFKSLIERKLDILIAINKTRMDYRKRYKEMIQEYLSGSVNLDKLFQNLIEFSQELDHEEKRYIREELGDEEELAVFDLLTKPDMKLNQKEIKQVKAVSRKLLETLKTEKLVLDWKKKQQTRAGVKVAIEEVLDDLPGTYSKDVYDGKCAAIYDYVYDMDGTIGRD
jgi:type I restriction enzyme R subunit